MGKKGNWLLTVKKVFIPGSKEHNKKKKTSGSGNSVENNDSKQLPTENVLDPVEEHEVTNLDQEKTQCPTSEDTIPSVEVTGQLVPHENLAPVPQKSSQEAAAIKIQTMIRGYLARRALRGLKGMVRLKSLVHGPSVKRQATTAMRCMQTLTKVQTQIQSRRIRMSEENQALKREMLQKREKDLEHLRASMDNWDDSPQSKEQSDANLLSKQEAAMRRERALAYAFSHQLRKVSSRSVNPLFTDLNNPHWGWSWMDRWAGEQTRDVRKVNDPQVYVTTSATFSEGETNKTQESQNLNSELSAPTLSNDVSHLLSSGIGRKNSATCQKFNELDVTDDDSRSMQSLQSDKPRRHSISGSTTLPNYMVPTKSAKARSKLQSPLAPIESSEKVSDTIKKKRSFKAAPRGKRQSFPPSTVEARSLSSITNSVDRVGDGINKVMTRKEIQV